MPLYLVPKRDGRPIVIDKAVLFVGRHPDCDVILTKSRKVSRKHCCLAQVDNQFFLRDLGSMNGVQVNGERVEGCAPVGIGDEIVIGDVHFELKGEGKSRREPAPKSAEPGGAATAPPRILEPPPDLSQDMPVPISEDDDEASFRVEETRHSVKPAAPSPRVDTIDDSKDDVVPIDTPAPEPFQYDDDDGSLPDVGL